MKIVIDLDENVFTRLFDNGVETSLEDRAAINRAIRNGKLYEERHAKPTGHWMKCKGTKYLICSNCGQYLDPNKILDFCPTCGADMRQKDKRMNKRKTIYKLEIQNKVYYYGDKILRICSIVVNIIEFILIIYLLIR